MVQSINGRVFSSSPNKRKRLARWEAAENRVSSILSPLIYDGCLVLNNVPFPYGNLDHVVIRPKGTTFLIETKSHAGQVTWNSKQLLINGHPFPSNPISQVNRGIRWIRGVTATLFRHNPWVVSVLVFPNAKVAIDRSVKRVNIMTTKDLLSFVRNYPEKRRPD